MSNSNEKQCNKCGVLVIPKIMGQALHCPTCSSFLGELRVEILPALSQGTRAPGFGTVETRTKPRGRGW